jgi:hypothetical protein
MGSRPAGIQSCQARFRQVEIHSPEVAAEELDALHT